MSILNEKIKELKLVEKNQIKEGRYYIPNPHPRRYFFGPLHTLQKGEGYYQNSYVLATVFTTVFQITSHRMDFYTTFSILHPICFRAGEFFILEECACRKHFLYNKLRVGIGYGSILLAILKTTLPYGGWDS